MPVGEIKNILNKTPRIKKLQLIIEKTTLIGLFKNKINKIINTILVLINKPLKIDENVLNLPDNSSSIIKSS